MTVMICCSTGNQTVNMIPVLALRIDQVVILSTGFAKSKGLTARLEGVLRGRRIRSRVLDITQETEGDILRFADIICRELDCWLDRTVFLNIGGGNKLFALAAAEAFRRSRNTNRRMVYSEPELRQLIVVDPAWRCSAQGYRVDLSLREILAMYGFRVFGNMRPLPLGPEGAADPNVRRGRGTARLYLEDEDFRSLFLRLAGERHTQDETSRDESIRQAIERFKPEDLAFDEGSELLVNLSFRLKNLLAQGKWQEALWILWKETWNQMKRKLVQEVQKNASQGAAAFAQDQLIGLREMSADDLKRLAAQLATVEWKMSRHEQCVLRRKDIQPPRRLGELFEWMVAGRVLEILNGRNDLAENVHQVCLSVKTVDAESPPDTPQEAEYDLVLVTRFGTLILMEVKSARFEGDTAKSKEFAAYQKSGPYGRTTIVGPLVKALETEDGDLPGWVPVGIRNQETKARHLGVRYCRFDELEAFLQSQLASMSGPVRLERK